MKETTNNRIKKSILKGFLIFFMTIGLIFILIVKNIFIKSFENLEKDDVDHHVEMVKSEIEHELDELMTMAVIWNETYLFYEGLDEKYSETNLDDETFRLFDVDMILLSDASGKLLYGKQIDFEAENIEEIDEVFSEKILQSGILENKELETSFDNMVVMDGHPILIASYPILQVANSEPAAGHLILGRIMSTDMISEISNRLNIGISFEMVSKIDFEKISLVEGKEIETQELNEEYIVSSFYTPELLGEYYMKISTEVPRNAVNIANNTIKVLRVIIPLILLFNLFVLWSFIDKVILSRIIKLNSQVVEIKEEEAFFARVDVSRNDEISELSQGINDMLGSLEKLQNKITNANKLLEKKVHERTEELRITNHKLEIEVMERTKLQEEASYLAHHDALTGLPNRLLLTDRLNQGILRAERHNVPISIMFIDLDGFKTINDTLGHNQGDDLLEQISKRLLASIRKSDSVYRLGGDEFILYIKDYKEEKSLDTIAAKIIDIFKEPFILEGQEYFITGSIGIAQYPKDGKDIKALIKNADTAMYQAKKLGKNRYQKY